MYRLPSLALAVALAASQATAADRSSTTRHEFQRANPCPSTGKTTGACPGYVKDHVIPLCKGGPDKPANLQWQSTGDAKAKDKWECK
jgi:hypothetical protein